MPLNSKVLVHWHDARLCPNIYSVGEAHGLNMSQFKTVGYLISRDSTTTKLASERDDEGQYRDVILIPTGSVISIRRLFLGSFM